MGSKASGSKTSGSKVLGSKVLGDGSNLRACAQRLFLNGSGSMARAERLEVLDSKASRFKARTLRLQA